MKQLYFALLAVIIILGCNKTTVTTKKTGTSTPQVLTGSYKLYHVADTTFDTSTSSVTIQSIEMKWQGGDTTYYNPGTQYYAVSVYQQYNPATALSDTLVFKTVSTGVENQGFGVSSPFTYSTQTKTWADSFQDAGEIQALFIINPNTIEVLTKLSADDYGAYYSKLP